MMYSGIGGILVLLVWLIGLAALFGVVYAAVRLGVLHALKAHTRWLQAGQPGSVTAAPSVGPTPPAPPAGPTPPAPSAGPTPPPGG